MTNLILSNLAKTWIIDVDGTMLKHNGYLNGGDVILDGVREFYQKISKDDKVILLTARKDKYIDELKKFLNKNNLRYDAIIYDLPHGERILINDAKESGLCKAYAINKERDKCLEVDFVIDTNYEKNDFISST